MLKYATRDDDPEITLERLLGAAAVVGVTIVRIVVRYLFGVGGVTHLVRLRTVLGRVIPGQEDEIMPTIGAAYVAEEDAKGLAQGQALGLELGRELGLEQGRALGHATEGGDNDANAPAPVRRGPRSDRNEGFGCGGARHRHLDRRTRRWQAARRRVRRSNALKP